MLHLYIKASLTHWPAQKDREVTKRWYERNKSLHSEDDNEEGQKKLKNSKIGG